MTNLINSQNLIVFLIVSISVFVTTGLMFFTVIIYIKMITFPVEHLVNAIELTTIPIRDSIVNTVSITSNMAVESAIQANNITTSVIATQQPTVAPQPIAIQSLASEGTPIDQQILHRRLLMVYIIGTIIFLSVNATVDYFTLVNSPIVN